MTKSEMLSEMGYEDFVLFDNPDFDSAIIGISDDNRVIYDYDKMVAHLMDVDGMEMLDAIEFIDYNTLGASPPPEMREFAPIVMYGLLDFGD
jgi:hypothetical protein